MKVLVTGAAGFVGNTTVRKLVERGMEVRAMVRNPEKAQMRLGDIADKIELVSGDVTDRNTLREPMEGMDAVIHTVAIALEKGGASYEEVNFVGTVNVVDSARSAGVKRFINISQNGANSELPYRFLRSKGKAQDYVVEKSEMDWTAVRPSAIFGPQDEFFNSIARLVLLTPVFFPKIGGGTAEFQPVSVYDVAEATVRSLEDETTIGKELGLGGPEVLTLGVIEQRIIDTLGSPRIFFDAPVPLLRPAVFVMENTLPGSPVSSSLLDLLSVPNVVEDNALVSQFNMEPIPFSGEHIAYLKDVSVGTALRKFFTGAAVN